MKKIINIMLLIIVMLLTSLFAKAEARIDDTTIATDLVSLPVYGSTFDWSNKTITYRFATNWAHFELVDVIADNKTAVLSKDIKYSYDWQNRIITITINSMKSNFSGTLFNILIRILPRVDFYIVSEVFEITPLDIVINDGGNLSTITLENRPATIRLDYVNSNLTYRSDVSLNYPNPFLDQTSILFSLSEASKVNIEIYNTNGICIQSIPGNGDVFIYELANSNHSIIPITENNTLEKGLYSIKLTADRSKLAKGAYYLVVYLGNKSHTIMIGVN